MSSSSRPERSESESSTSWVPPPPKRYRVPSPLPPPPSPPTVPKTIWMLREVGLEGSAVAFDEPFIAAKQPDYTKYMGECFGERLHTLSEGAVCVENDDVANQQKMKAFMEEMWPPDVLRATNLTKRTKLSSKKKIINSSFNFLAARIHNRRIACKEEPPEEEPEDSPEHSDDEDFEPGKSMKVDQEGIAERRSTRNLRNEGVNGNALEEEELEEDSEEEQENGLEVLNEAAGQLRDEEIECITLSSDSEEEEEEDDSEEACLEKAFKKFKPFSWLDKYSRSQQYVAPDTRILITKNITFDEKNIIPTYSDISGESPEDLRRYRNHRPANTEYIYADVNQTHWSEDDLKQAIELGKQKKNVIRCNCCSKNKEDPFVKSCFGNENCPCYKTNKAMQKLQTSTETVTEFWWHFPVLRHCRVCMFGVVRMQGQVQQQCTHDRPELYASIGNLPQEPHRWIRTAIFSVHPDWHSISRVSRNLRDFETMQKKSKRHDDLGEEFAYELSGPRNTKWRKFILEHKKWTPSYEKLLKKLSRRSIQCMAKEYGNAARMMSHSCTPNCDIIRIYQKSLSPVHCHLVVVALQDIPPGVPLTIDYGEHFVKEHLKNGCQCGTFACENGPDFDKFKTFDTELIALCLLHFSKIQREVYDKTISSTPEELNSTARTEGLNHKIAMDALENEYNSLRETLRNRGGCDCSSCVPRFREWGIWHEGPCR